MIPEIDIIDILINDLDEYPWYQIKKHRLTGITVYTCLIQPQAGRRVFVRGCHPDLCTSIREALRQIQAEDK